MFLPVHDVLSINKQGDKGLIILGSEITADGDCSHEIKRHLVLRRKVMTNLDSIFKIRDIILLIEVHLVKSMGFFTSYIWM